MSKVKIGIAIEEEALERIDAIVEERRDIESRSEALRWWSSLGRDADQLFEEHDKRLDRRGRRAVLRQALIDHFDDEFGD